MIRLRVAGGLVVSDWVRLRLDKAGRLHAIVETHHWGGRAEVPDIVTDIDLEMNTDGIDLERDTAPNRSAEAS